MSGTSKNHRAAASRANGARSKGPVSLAGRQKSSGNAIRHGILSRQLIVPGEDAAEYQALLSQLKQEFRPGGILEAMLVERIAVAFWR